MHVDKPLNICLISREYPDETGWGGIGKYTYRLAHGLTDLGHNVHILAESLDKDKAYIENRISIQRILNKNFFHNKDSLTEFVNRLNYSWCIFKKIEELIDKYHIDIIEGPNFYGEAYAYSLCKKTSLVTRLHTTFSEIIAAYEWRRTTDCRLSCWIEDATILKSDLVTCSTKRHADIVLKSLPAKPKNIKIIPLGVPLPILNGRDNAKNEKLSVLFVGRLEKRKGIQTLVKAIPEVLKEIPNIEFNIVGRDTFLTSEGIFFTGKESDSFKNKLINDIPREYLTNVNFLGFLEDKKLEEYYRSCDLFVAPSLYESFGFIYIEAMSYAKPVIGCSVGGVPEVVKNSETGILVAPENPNQLAQAIIRLLKNKDLREQMGISARKHVEENFTLEQMVSKTIAAYHNVCRPSNRIQM
ncbi:MAG: glycosyltransferase family 4 protein [Candidatus Omnitrophota bacterium]